VSRSGTVNFGQQQFSAWASTQIQTCSGTITVTAPNDVVVCNGQLREASNDNPSGAFEAGGVEFIAENGGGAGVRLRKGDG